MASTDPHCSVDYHRFSPVDLETFAHAVSAGIYSNNPPFASPPIATAILFDGVITTYHNAYEAYKNGGADQKGAFMTARTALIAQLDTTAGYVDGLAGVDADMITLAGFTPTKTGETSSVVPLPPSGVKVTRGVSGELFAECDPQAGVQYFTCLVTAGNPVPGALTANNAGQFILYNIENPPAPPMPSVTLPNGALAMAMAVDLTKGRKKHFTGLVKGMDYYFYFCAGNSAGVSPMSEAVVLMCG